jgi:hypothetical protein
MKIVASILSLAWLGLGIWYLFHGEFTNMLICYAISTIWAASRIDE